MTEFSSMATTFEKWWGRYEINEGQTGQWSIGPLKLWIQHLRHEWRIVYERVGDQLSTTLKVNVPFADGRMPESGEVHRYSFYSKQDSLTLTPVLADRDVISQPENMFSILPGEKLPVYVSTPLWLRVEGGPLATVLEEFPIHRPSDTWFGPSTVEGELCYASKTSCRLELSELPFRPHRATTAVIIENNATEMLMLKNLMLPVRYLSLYASNDGHLWTDSVILRHFGDEKLTPVHIGKRPPSYIKIREKVSDPRERADRNLLLRAFTGFFQ